MSSTENTRNRTTGVRVRFVVGILRGWQVVARRFDCDELSQVSEDGQEDEESLTGSGNGPADRGREPATAGSIQPRVI